MNTVINIRALSAIVLTSMSYLHNLTCTHHTPVMQTAWRERNPEVRIKSARSALDLNPECASAYILLAEEECTSIIEVEKKLKIALKHAENNYRKSQVTQHQSSTMEALHSGWLVVDKCVRAVLIFSSLTGTTLSLLDLCWSIMKKKYECCPRIICHF